MKDSLYVADIVENTIVDGVGFRTSLYLSGCDIHCAGCHNSSNWDIESGTLMSVDNVYKSLIKEITNITFIGGEPMMQAKALCILAKRIKCETNKTIWVYSGHTYEEISENPLWYNLVQMCDVLVDGRFEQEYFVNNLRFRGSENQRIIDIKKSLLHGNIVFWQDVFI